MASRQAGYDRWGRCSSWNLVTLLRDIFSLAPVLDRVGGSCLRVGGGSCLRVVGGSCLHVGDCLRVGGGCDADGGVTDGRVRVGIGGGGGGGAQVAP